MPFKKLAGNPNGANCVKGPFLERLLLNDSRTPATNSKK
jgi:hypothetical protein